MQQDNGFDCGAFSASNAVTACPKTPPRPFQRFPSLDIPRLYLLRQVRSAVLRAIDTSRLSLTEERKAV